MQIWKILTNITFKSLNQKLNKPILTSNVNTVHRSLTKYILTTVTANMHFVNQPKRFGVGHEGSCHLNSVYKMNILKHVILRFL